MKVIGTFLCICFFSCCLTACTVVVTDDMVVSPTKEIDKDNLDHLMQVSKYEKVTIKTQAGMSITGLQKNQKNTNTTLLVLPGNALNLSLQPWFGVLNAVSPLDVNILAIDYQGFGESEGEASFSSMIESAEDAINSISKDQSIYVYGLSLGSVMALEVAKDERVKGIIIEGGITTDEEMIALYQSRNILGSLASVELGEKLKFNNLLALNNLNKPVLVIHGMLDENIPVSMGQQIFNASSHHLSELYLVEEGGHCDTFLRDEENYINRISNFMKVVSAK